MAPEGLLQQRGGTEVQGIPYPISLGQASYTDLKEVGGCVEPAMLALHIRQIPQHGVILENASAG